MKYPRIILTDFIVYFCLFALRLSALLKTGSFYGTANLPLKMTCSKIRMA